MDIEVSGGAATAHSPAAATPSAPKQQQAAKTSTPAQKGTPDYDSNTIETRAGPL